MPVPGAIEAGVEPAALVDVINEAQAQRAAVRAELDNTPAPTTLDAAEIYAMIDALGDVGDALSGASAERLASLYQAVTCRFATSPARTQPTSPSSR